MLREEIVHLCALAAPGCHRRRRDQGVPAGVVLAAHRESGVDLGGRPDGTRPHGGSWGMVGGGGTVTL
jgi:hypothetical protein